MYRAESFRDIRSTYPAKSNPAVPSMFRATLSTPMTKILPSGFKRSILDAATFPAVGSRTRSFPWAWRGSAAVAETESLTLAAKSKLHTSQPSLSRRLRDLEEEIGAQLMTRTARGVELTPAGRVFLDHARGVLLQVDAAAEADSMTICCKS